METCPVCGKTLDDDTAVASFWTRTRFCSDSCRYFFDTDYFYSKD